MQFDNINNNLTNCNKQFILMNKKILTIVFSILTFAGIINAVENQKSNLKDYTGQYSFINVENSNLENVRVELHGDSTLKAVASMGEIIMKLVKENEFKVSEYDGKVLFIRDETSQKVIGVKVFVPSVNIEAEGKKEQIETVE